MNTNCNLVTIRGGGYSTRLPKGGLRQSDRKIRRLSDYSYGGDLRG